MGGGVFGGLEGPGGTVESITDYYTHRGYSEDPMLESKETNQVKSFGKPLPDGRRDHIRVLRGSKYYRVDRHIDAYDPNKNPIGHIQDIVFSPQHEEYRVKRQDI